MAHAVKNNETSISYTFINYLNDKFKEQYPNQDQQFYESCEKYFEENKELCIQDKPFYSCPVYIILNHAFTILTQNENSQMDLNDDSTIN